MSANSSASTRRELLKRCGVLGLTSLGGCACPWPSLRLGDVPALRPGALSPPPPQGGSLDLPIVIDAHCHIFNVEDVPASPMLKGPIAHAVTRTFGRKLIKALADVVSAIAYFLTPSARGELQMLKELSASYLELLRVQSPDPAGAAIAKHLTSQIERFSRAFAIAARDPRFAAPYLEQLSYHTQRAKGATQALPRVEQELSEDRIRDLVTGQHGLRAMAFDPSDPGNLVRFAFTLTSPRYLNLGAMQRAYSGGKGIPAVDVFCPSLLDLDHWLGCKDTATVQDDQVRLLEQIALMSGGTTLPFVGFNPRSDLVQDGASFARVVDAISNRGFIGVKLYPPMGYLAYGNACQDSRSACPTMKDAREIDARLCRLYEWCRDHDVPIMSHTSHSFGRTDAYDDCASPVGWQRALDRFAGLRVQAGHFGGDSDHALANGWAAEYVRLMGTPGGRRLHADLSNLDDLFVDGTRVREAIQPLFKAKLSDASAEIGADRMVYGSDWYMTQLSGVAGACVDQMSTYLGRIEGELGIPKLRERVFGLNAVKLYGLAADPADGRAANRERLERYYGDKGFMPAWMEGPGGRHGSGDSAA